MLNRIEKLERRFICKNCNKKYMPTRSDSKFCSSKCRVHFFRKQKTKQSVTGKVTALVQEGMEPPISRWH